MVHTSGPPSRAKPSACREVSISPVSRDPGGDDPAWTTFVKDSGYELMAQAFGGVGVRATSPDELTRAVKEALACGKPTLVNAIIDEKAGTESGRIGNLNPQSVVSKK